MKIYIAVDIEGISGVYRWAQGKRQAEAGHFGVPVIMVSGDDDACPAEHRSRKSRLMSYERR